MFVLALITSIVSTTLAAIFGGLFLKQKFSSKIEIKSPAQDLASLDEAEWQLQTATPEMLVARMATITNDMRTQIVDIQQKLAQGCVPNIELATNTLRSIVKGANAISGLKTSMNQCATTAMTNSMQIRETTTTHGATTEVPNAS